MQGLEGRLRVIEEGYGEHQVMIRRIVAQLDDLQYQTTLLMQKDRAAADESRRHFGQVKLDGSIVAGPLNASQEWAWIDSRASDIGPAAFAGAKVSRVTFSMNADVEKIGDSAFKNCRTLDAVVVPRSVVEIADDAFEGSALRAVTFEFGASLEIIGVGAFARTPLRCLQLPSSLSVIGASAFDSCELLESVSFGSNSRLSLIGGSAFFKCVSLTQIAIPGGVRKLSGRCFEGCERLVLVTIAGSSLRRIGGGAFNACVALKMISLPGSVEVVGERAGELCTSRVRAAEIDGVWFDNLPTQIGAFQNCLSLEKVLLDEGSALQEVGERCFSGCSRLQSVDAAPRLRLIGPAAFADCSSLETPPLPGVVERIAESAMSGCAALVTVRLPANTETIGARAFQGCTALVRVSAADARLKVLGDWAFDGCRSLGAITGLSLPILFSTNALPAQPCKFE